MANKPNRSRGRGRKPGNNTNRSYESNGPDVKIRGNAAHISEKYQQLARDASASGDRIGAENYLQHAEHYYRLVLASQQQNQEQREQQQRNNGDDGNADNQSDSQNDASGNNNSEGGERAARADRNERGDSGDADGNREGNSRRRTRRRRDTVRENADGSPGDEQQGNRAHDAAGQKSAADSDSDGDAGKGGESDDALAETA